VVDAVVDDVVVAGGSAVDWVIDEIDDVVEDYVGNDATIDDWLYFHDYYEHGDDCYYYCWFDE